MSKTFFTSDGGHIEFEGSELIKGNEPGACWHCGCPTRWVDTNFQALLCSEECSRAKWEEYFKEDLVSLGGHTFPVKDWINAIELYKGM